MINKALSVWLVWLVLSNACLGMAGSLVVHLHHDLSFHLSVGDADHPDGLCYDSAVVEDGQTAHHHHHIILEGSELPSARAHATQVLPELTMATPVAYLSEKLWERPSVYECISVMPSRAPPLLEPGHHCIIRTQVLRL